MSNQILLWSMLVLPWLTLIFMNKEDIKRFTPVGVFTALTSVLIGDVGVTFGLWIHQQTAYPFQSVMPFDIGLNLILTMWIFKYTYGRFRKYFVVNLLLDIGFNTIFFGRFLPSRDILHVVGGTPLQMLVITLSHAILIYGYQIWQEKIFVMSEKTSYRANLQPAAAKPLQDKKENQSKDEQ